MDYVTSKYDHKMRLAMLTRIAATVLRFDCFTDVIASAHIIAMVASIVFNSKYQVKEDL